MRVYALPIELLIELPIVLPIVLPIAWTAYCIA